MKKGFTIVEVSILFIIFLIVAFLVVPLSLDDTKQAKNISRWISAQQEFENMYNTVIINNYTSYTGLKDNIEYLLTTDDTEFIDEYKISFMDGTEVRGLYNFDDYKLTKANAVFAIKLLKESNNNQIGMLMYDVNGKDAPNTWGKDVFGFNIYKDRLEPFGKDKTFIEQKSDCSKDGLGIYCSNYYLIGGKFD